MSEVAYRHRQTGWPTIITVAGILVVELVAVTFMVLKQGLPQGKGWVGAAAISMIVFVLVVVLMLFSSLTVAVADEVIEVRFGPGIIHKSFRLAEVDACCATRTRWWHGWGIHRRIGGWIFNIAGFDAVELTMKDGRHYWIGTDEPQQLCAAIERKLNKPS
jgi:hypothetical protein